jgi:hypothetical protein
MADISDVEQSIVDLVSGLVYPNGAGAPSALTGAVPVRVYRGWPLPASMDADMAAGVANISVFSRGGTELNSTRYPVDYQDVNQVTPTLTVSVRNNTVTIGGTLGPYASQFITVLMGPRFVVSYQPIATDTTTTIAQAIAAQISAGFAIATTNGSVITVNSSTFIRALVGTTGSQLAETRRQRTQMQITIWCNVPAVRDELAKLIEPTLSLQTFLIMPDTSACRFRYHNTLVIDIAEKNLIYRRDLIYTAEYATTVGDDAVEVTSINNKIEGGNLGTGPVNNNYLPTQRGPTPVNARTPFVPLVPN